MRKKIFIVLMLTTVFLMGCHKDDVSIDTNTKDIETENVFTENNTEEAATTENVIENDNVEIQTDNNIETGTETSKETNPYLNPAGAEGNHIQTSGMIEKVFKNKKNILIAYVSTDEGQIAVVLQDKNKNLKENDFIDIAGEISGVIENDNKESIPLVDTATIKISE